jgi:hypothetical protein
MIGMEGTKISVELVQNAQVHSGISLIEIVKSQVFFVGTTSDPNINT